MLPRPNFLRRPGKVDARASIYPGLARGIISLELGEGQRVYTRRKLKLNLEERRRTWNRKHRVFFFTRLPRVILDDFGVIHASTNDFGMIPRKIHCRTFRERERMTFRVSLFQIRSCRIRV